MPYVLFHSAFPKVAEAETRSIFVPPNAKPPLPPGEYGFIESFCDEPDCDCRRVFLSVYSKQDFQLHAVIAFGWETREYYASWAHEDDSSLIDSLQGPVLNLGSPQSALAPTLLDIATNVLLKDTAYVERIKRHYRMFRARIHGAARREQIRPQPARRRKLR